MSVMFLYLPLYACVQQQIHMYRVLRATFAFSQQAYSKFRISRTPQESLVFFFKNEVTVKQLLDNIRQNFQVKDSTLLAASTYDSAIIGYPVLPEAEKATEELSDQLLLPLLISGEMFIYEANSSRVRLCYGIECEQFNQTNNRNLPERISNGVIDLNSEWLSARTVGEALAPPSPIDTRNKEVIEEREELRGSIQKAHMRLLSLSKFSGEYYAGSPTHTFTVRMLALMGINWAFLFGLTYGGYGWDVGEPVSYLTALGVQVAAMGGWYDMEKQLELKIAEEEGQWWGRLNIEAQKRAQAWLLSYHRRQFY